MFAALAYLPIIDSIAKVLLECYPVLQVVWAQVFFHLAVMVPMLLLGVDRCRWWPRQPKLQLLRGCFMFLITVLFFSALSTMPLVDTIALVFTALSPWLLGERVGPRRGWQFTLSAPALVFGLLLVTTRKLSGGDDPLWSRLPTRRWSAVWRRP